MIVTFVCPSAPHPVGGVIAFYEFGNALARRGHQVHLVHAPFFRNRIESLDELSWFSFDPRVHHIVSADEAKVPDADIFFGRSDDPAHGLPVILIQGVEMLHIGVEREAFRSRALKVCIASWLVDVGRRFGVDADQFEVVHMGIDHERFRVRTPPPDRGPVVGILHSSHEAKGWEVGRAALEAAHRERPELEALVFGTSTPPGPLPPWMTFRLNPTPTELATEVYDRSAVFVQSSHYEGFGFTAVEAMACGAALATTDNGGSRDYAFADRTALVSPPGDADALAANVVALLADRERRLRIAEAGRAHVAGFSWDQAGADLEACLLRYLADPAAYQHEPGPEPPGALEDGFALR
ncbi:MAG: glycosyltransferase family 4 protein [Acidimicrobiales bacterium]|nr:glycosyltransferase family 4 protein [Actinomycetota bacterium]